MAPLITSPKQQHFCQEYLVDLNATQAYMRVYKVKNKRVAASNAARMLTNANIQAFVDHLKKNLAETAGIGPLKILLEHKKIAFSSFADIHLTWITRKEFEDLTDDQKACIQEISTKTETIFDPVEKKPVKVEYVKIKLYDKHKSLDSILKMLGWDPPTKINLTSSDKFMELMIKATSQHK